MAIKEVPVPVSVPVPVPLPAAAAAASMDRPKSPKFGAMQDEEGFALFCIVSSHGFLS